MEKYGGHKQRGREGIIEMHGSCQIQTHYTQEQNEQGEWIDIDTGSKYFDGGVTFKLPHTAFNLGLRGPNSPYGHPLEHVWDELVIHHFSGSTDVCEAFSSAIGKAHAGNDIDTIDLLVKWVKKLSPMEVTPFLNISPFWAEDPYEYPLQKNVAKLLRCIDELIIHKGQIPTKKQIRVIFEQYKDSKTVSESESAFDDAIKKAGLLWLKSSTK